MAVRTSPPAVVIDTQPVRRRRATLLVITSAVVTVLAVTVAAVLVIGDSTQPAPAIDRCGILQGLANGRQIPEMAVPRACDEVLRNLVNLGLIPEQALQPATTPTEAPRMTREEIMRDLVNRGLIPEQALSDTGKS